MLAQGYAKDKACVLIALDALFENTDIDWGKEFLEEFFIDTGCDGFNTSDLIIVEESAPVIILSQGSFTSTYIQGESYWQVVAWDTRNRYRLPYNREVILLYVTDAEKHIGHAVCIKAARVNEYLDNYKFNALILPKQGLIVDKCYPIYVDIEEDLYK
jgi:hypothetical protein